MNISMNKFTFHNLVSPIVGLSPMDGVTDCAYREIVKKYGEVDLLYTEFVNVHGLSLGIERLFEEFQYTEFQRPVLSQIYGHEVEYFYPAATICLMLGFNGVDINMGCPAKKVSDRGAGAGLIQYPDNAKNIILEVKRAREDFREFWKGKKYSSELVNEYFIKHLSGLKDLKVNPLKLAGIVISLIDKWEIDKDFITSEERLSALTVSVKTRIGYDSENIEWWIKTLSEVSFDFIAIHGRTLKQMYAGSASWEAIKKGVDSTSIPVLANGDIKSHMDAKACLDLTGAAGVLVGRGTYGDPSLISNTKKYLKEGITDFSSKEISEIKKIIFDHTLLFTKFKGERRFFEMRKNLAWSVQGFPNASELRKKLVVTNSASEVENILNNSL